MNGINANHDALKRQRWDDNSSLYSTAFARTNTKLLGLSSTGDGDVASAVVPPVTVVLEGRSICHRINLSRHASYQSLAAALHRMFVDMEGDEDCGEGKIEGLDLSNAVPGHMVAYEDVEDDLLLAGDLNWK